MALHYSGEWNIMAFTQIYMWWNRVYIWTTHGSELWFVAHPAPGGSFKAVVGCDGGFAGFSGWGCGFPRVKSGPQSVAQVLVQAWDLFESLRVLRETSKRILSCQFSFWRFVLFFGNQGSSKICFNFNKTVFLETRFPRKFPRRNLVIEASRDSGGVGDFSQRSLWVSIQFLLQVIEAYHIMEMKVPHHGGGSTVAGWWSNFFTWQWNQWNIIIIIIVRWNQWIIIIITIIIIAMEHYNYYTHYNH